MNDFIDSVFTLQKYCQSIQVKIGNEFIIERTKSGFRVLYEIPINIESEDVYDYMRYALSNSNKECSILIRFTRSPGHFPFLSKVRFFDSELTEHTFVCSFQFPYAIEGNCSLPLKQPPLVRQIGLYKTLRV